MGGVSKGMRPEGWPRFLFGLAGNASLFLVRGGTAQRPKMSTKHRDFIPARMSPGKKDPRLLLRPRAEVLSQLWEVR